MKSPSIQTSGDSGIPTSQTLSPLVSDVVAAGIIPERSTDQAFFIVKVQEKEQTNAETNIVSGQKGRGGGLFVGWSLSDRIAGIASIAALLQFFALVATILVMVRNGRRQLRAYVFPESAGLYDGTMTNPPVLAHANEPGVVLLIRNIGQTPAYKVISWANVAVIEHTNQHTLVVPDLQQIEPNFMGANGTMPKSLWFGRPLTPTEIEDVQASTRGIYVYGRLEYFDAFKRRRWINFRYVYSGPFPPPQGVIFALAERGNDAN
jgi:hypothetical protein